MTLRLFCPDETEPVPRKVIMVLSCDGGYHGLFAPAPQHFEGPGFIAQHIAAMRAGWKETEEEGFLCPECSGK